MNLLSPLHLLKKSKHMMPPLQSPNLLEPIIYGSLPRVKDKSGDIADAACVHPPHGKPLAQLADDCDLGSKAFGRGIGMFDFLKKRKVETGVSSASNGGRFESYKAEVIEAANKQFGETWPYDPQWVDVVGVARDLDAANGNNDRMGELQKTIQDSFHQRKPAKLTASLVVLQHLENQQNMEDLLRKSGNARIFPSR